MSFDPLLKPEPEAPPAPAPDPMAAVNTRLSEMERQLTEVYRQNKGMATQPQVQYVPVPYPPQGNEPQGLSEAEILADLPNAITTLAERIAAEKEASLRQEIGGALGQLYQKEFDRDLSTLKAHPYFKDVKDQLDEWISSSGNDRYLPGRLQSKFHELVGAHAVNRPLDPIDQVERVERVRAVEPQIPISSSPLPPASGGKKEPVQLDESRQRLLDRYNKQWGLNMTPEEWKAIEDGRLLEGTRE